MRYIVDIEYAPKERDTISSYKLENHLKWWLENQMYVSAFDVNVTIEEDE